MSIKYYHLAKDEELPEEFCAIRDEGGEPNGYVFYVPEAENAKLRELVKAMTPFLCCMPFASCNTLAASVRKRMRELGIEVDE